MGLTTGESKEGFLVPFPRNPTKSEGEKGRCRHKKARVNIFCYSNSIQYQIRAYRRSVYLHNGFFICFTFSTTPLKAPTEPLGLRRLYTVILRAFSLPLLAPSLPLLLLAFASPGISLAILTVARTIRAAVPCYQVSPSHQCFISPLAAPLSH